jgi:sec-independent protein translocase protein TatC
MGVALSWGKVPVILSAFIHPVGEVVFLSPAEPFLIHLKVAILCGLMLASPMIAREAWSFVRPAAYPFESRLFLFFLPVSVLLFLVGAWFGWGVLLPAALGFLLQFGSQAMAPMISVGAYVDFAGWLIVGSALIFETPIVILFLAWRGIVTPRSLARQWKAAAVVTLIVAALLTPTPDVVTQLLLAAPMAGLYLLSIGLAYVVAK